MGKFYQFKYIFIIGLHIFLFPSLIFFLNNIKIGWRKWYRLWRNSLIRIGGWKIMKDWESEFKKDRFFEKLKEAEKKIKILRDKEI